MRDRGVEDAPSSPAPRGAATRVGRAGVARDGRDLDARDGLEWEMLRLPIVPPPDAPGARDASATATATAPLPDLRDDDLHGVLVAFYDVVTADALLAPYFAALDMTAHMPRIVDFWSTMVFHTGRYAGNAFRPHLVMPGLTAAHFARWVATLEATVDERHAGAAAERMKELAHRVAYGMQLRLGIEPFAPYA
jgi:hemoglobin